MSFADRRRSRRLLLKSLPLAVLPSIVMAATAAAGDEPGADANTPVTMVLPYAPGGAVDVVVRQLQPGLRTAFGRNVLIDNRAGSAGLVAAGVVARARADGNTLLLTFDAHAINPVANKHLPYDTFHDFTPIVQLARFPLVLAAHPSLAVSNVRELAALARERPNGLRYASAGAGSLNQMAMAALASNAGVKLVHVPFKSGGHAVEAVLTGEADVLFSSYAALQAHVAARTLKILGVAGETRLRQAPQVQTLAEQGFRGCEAYSWIGVFGPAGLAPARVTRAHDALVTALHQPGAAEAMSAQGFEIVTGSPGDLGNLVRSEHDRWLAVARKANLQFD